MENQLDGRHFWERLDSLNKEQLKDLCERAEVNYNTLRCNRVADRLPSLVDAYKLATTVGASVEYLLTGRKTEVANEGYETRLMRNILEKAPELYHTLVVTYGYAGAMADEIQQDKSTGA